MVNFLKQSTVAITLMSKKEEKSFVVFNLLHVTKLLLLFLWPFKIKLHIKQLLVLLINIS